MNRLLRKRHIGLISISAVVVMLLSAQSHAQGYYQRYLDVKVTLTNITKSIVLTPPLLAVSKKPQPLFALGKPASDALAMIAEGGDTSKLANVLMSKGIDVYTWDAPIGPASSASLMIRLHPTDYLHLASMLLPTNDAFIGLNGLSVRRFRKHCVLTMRVRKKMMSCVQVFQGHSVVVRAIIQSLVKALCIPMQAFTVKVTYLWQCTIGAIRWRCCTFRLSRSL